jgi:steroid 5-alpha reductase family enzyme
MGSRGFTLCVAPYLGFAVYIVASNPSYLQKPLDALDIIGILVWCFGFGVEAYADYEKNLFKNANPTKFITTGLWKYSRHPNYCT